MATKGDNRDTVGIEIRAVTYNQGSGYIMRKHYATSRHKSWILQEMDVRNMTNNIALIYAL